MIYDKALQKRCKEFRKTPEELLSYFAELNHTSKEMMLLKHSIDLMKTGDYKYPIIYMERIKKEWENNDCASSDTAYKDLLYLNLGTTYLNRGRKLAPLQNDAPYIFSDCDQIVENFQKAQLSTRTFFSATEGLCKYYIESGDYPNALDCLKKFIEHFDLEKNQNSFGDFLDIMMLFSSYSTAIYIPVKKQRKSALLSLGKISAYEYMLEYMERHCSQESNLDTKMKLILVAMYYFSGMYTKANALLEKTVLTAKHMGDPYPQVYFWRALLDKANPDANNSEKLKSIQNAIDMYDEIEIPNDIEKSAEAKRIIKTELAILRILYAKISFSLSPENNWEEYLKSSLKSISHDNFLEAVIENCIAEFQLKNNDLKSARKHINKALKKCPDGLILFNDFIINLKERNICNLNNFYAAIDAVEKNDLSIFFSDLTPNNEKNKRELILNIFKQAIGQLEEKIFQIELNEIINKALERFPDNIYFIEKSVELL